MSLIYNVFSYMFGSSTKKNETKVVEEEMPSLVTPDSRVLHLFYNVGRDTSDQVLDNFANAAAQESLLYTMKTIAYIRNVRGERALARRLLNWLQRYDERQLIANMPLFLQKYGRYDDFMYLPRKSDAMYAYIKHLGEQLVADHVNMELGKPVSLAAKWVPSETSALNKETALTFRLARAMKVSMSELRKKYLTPLRAHIGILEQKMCKGDWANVDYASVPTQAFKRHIKAFEENDEARFIEYMMSRVPKVSLAPHNVLTPYYNGEPQNEETEAKMREFAPLTKTVVLGNGSLVSTTLSLLSNHIVAVDKVVKVMGETFFEKVRNICSFPVSPSLNICGALKLILEEKLGTEKLIIIGHEALNKADTLYNDATRETMEKMFSDAGVKMPQIVYWNVNAEPIWFDTVFGISTVSGFSTDVLQCIMKNELPTPFNVMMNGLNDDKFGEIKEVI
jgi:hypothetical protein